MLQMGLYFSQDALSIHGAASDKNANHDRAQKYFAQIRQHSYFLLPYWWHPVIGLNLSIASQFVKVQETKYQERMCEKRLFPDGSTEA
jgi:hypothetical protein